MRKYYVGQGEKEYPTYIKERKANWFGHILRRNCLLERIIEGKIKEGIEVTERQGIIRKQLRDALKEIIGYGILKEEVLDCTVWKTWFGRGYGPIVTQTRELIN